MNRRIEPGPGQESVWDYPRPPRVEPVPERLRVILNGVTIAETTNALRVLETSHPPTYYIPPADVQMDYLRKTPRRTFCEFKGAASYWTITVDGVTRENAAWSYDQASGQYADLAGYLSFYAGQFDACYVGEAQVDPQEGSFYGGWVTSKVVGPFKGGPGTMGW